MPNCVHCSNPLEVSQEASGFCCTGCEFVYQLIHDEGLENFYDLKREDTLAPLSDKPFQKHDFSWLQPASNNDGLCRWDGSLQGISCIGCVWLVEKLYMRHDGAVRCDVAPADGAIHLEWQEDVLDPVEFAEELQKFGYLLGKQRSISSGGEEVRQLARKTAVCGAFAMNAMVFSLPRYLGMPDDFMFAGIFEMIAMISATLAMLVGGAWFIRRSFHSLRAGVLHMDTPIALGVSTAYAGSVFGWSLGYFDLVYFDFVAVFIFLMLGGRWIQTVAVARNRNRLLDQTPVPRAVKNSPERAEVPLDALSIGDHYVSDTGQTLPVASKVVDGAGDFSLEWINGEPEPCHFSTGMHVPAGAILLSRSELVLEASQAWQDSLLAQLTAEGKTSDRSLLLEKILRVYLAAVITLGIGGALFWWSTGSGAERALQVMISVFVISCPCALGVALPMADELASSAMQRLGVFVRQSGFWSKVRRVRTLFFDKTGTLTGEVPELIEPDLLSTLSRPQVAALATMCAGSPHPLSRSLMRALGTAGQRAIEPEAEPEEIPGLGMLYQHGGHTWSLGKCGWQGTKDETATAQSDGCELRKDGSLIAEFRFSESLRPDAKEIIQSLANYKP
ncbi:MAG: heavy metal translocating P-type ATPase, partial [Akkermansiaceae bacterium]